MGVLSSTPDQDQGNSSSRGRQCQSRSSEQGEVRPDRVQATSRSVSVDQPSVWSSHDRLDGRSAEHSVAEVYLSLSGPSQLGQRCLQEQPGGGERLRTSSNGPDSSSGFSGTSATGRGDLGHSQLEGALAPFAQANVGLPTDTGAVQTGSSFSRTPTGQVSALQLPPRSSRLEDLRTAMTDKGFTKKIISHALKRWPRGSSDDSY